MIPDEQTQEIDLNGCGGCLGAACVIIIIVSIVVFYFFTH